MVFDARGMMHPEPLEKMREYFRDNCRETIDFRVIVDTSQCAKMADAFAKMSKCKTRVEKDGDHYVIHVTGTSCACG